MYPYAEFLLRFANKQAGFVHDSTGDGGHVAVIIESRPNFWTPLVLRNVMYFLGADWRLVVVCSEESGRFLATGTGAWKIEFLPLISAVNFPKTSYNQMLQDSEFWQRFPEEKILIFQSDCILCGHHIKQFMEYDFIGAPCHRLDEHFIVNGGLSLRSRSRMLEAIAHRSSSAQVQEDVFFTQALRSLGARLPDLKTAADFAVESAYHRTPLGVHGTDKYFHDDAIARRIVAAIDY